MFIVKLGDRTKGKSNFQGGQTFSTDSSAIVLRDESEKVNIGELPQFTFEMLANATDQFHENNLLGRGGFGLVYKVYIKRLTLVFLLPTMAFFSFSFFLSISFVFS